jgi:hypothetical protein
MALNKKQAEMVVHARIVATDPTLALAAANLTFILEKVLINGVEHPVSILDSSAVASLQTSMTSIHNIKKSIS